MIIRSIESSARCRRAPATQSPLYSSYLIGIEVRALVAVRWPPWIQFEFMNYNSRLSMGKWVPASPISAATFKEAQEQLEAREAQWRRI